MGDINKVWLSGVVTTPPVHTRLGGRTPSTTFKIRVEEKFINHRGEPQIRPTDIIVESLGRNSERALQIVKAGVRFMVEGYLREEDGKIIVRTFSIYPDDSGDGMLYKKGITQALDVLRSSRDLNSATEKLEELLT